MSDENGNSQLNDNGRAWLEEIESHLDQTGKIQIEGAIQKSNFFAGEINAAGEANLSVSFDTNSAGILYNPGDGKVHIGSDLSGWEAQGLTAAPIAHELAHALQVNGNPDNVSVPDQGIDGALEKSHTEEGVAYAAQYIYCRATGRAFRRVNQYEAAIADVHPVCVCSAEWHRCFQP